MKVNRWRGTGTFLVAHFFLLNETSGKLELISKYNNNNSSDLGRVHKYFKEDNFILNDVFNKKSGKNSK